MTYFDIVFNLAERFMSERYYNLDQQIILIYRSDITPKKRQTKHDFFKYVKHDVNKAITIIARINSNPMLHFINGKTKFGEVYDQLSGYYIRKLEMDYNYAREKPINRGLIQLLLTKEFTDIEGFKKYQNFVA